MRTLAKTLLFSILMLIFAGTINAQPVENLLKNAVPELYGALKITPDKKYNTKQKEEYRDLYYKLDKANQDIIALRMDILTKETVQVFDFQELYKLRKEDSKIDSLETIVLSYMVSINDYMKWDERLAADSLGAPIAYTTYKDLFTQKKYDEAYTAWSVLFKKYPLISSSIYTGGASLVSYKIDKATDETEKQLYIDTLFMLYDQQIKVYPQKEGYVLGRKTVDFHNFYIKDQNLDDSLVRIKVYENFELANEAIEKGGANTNYYVFPIAMKFSIIEYLLDTISADQALDNYLLYSDIMSAQYEAETDADKKEKIKKGGMDPLDNMFTNSDLSTCEHLVPTFQKKFDANPEDPKNLKKILTTLGRKNCVESQLYTDVAVALYIIEPTASYAHTLALLYFSKEDYTNSAEYFDKAIASETIDTLKGKYYFEAATVYNKQGQYSKARDYARNAIQLKPNCGKAYLLIATMYAATASSVGNDNFAHQAVYWAAVDKLIAAKNADPSITEEANSLINTYSARYPKKEEGFMQGFTEGTTYTVGGWIGETTTARYLK
ncbi:MAG: hypothetical protein JXL97_15875 [Bacteroidales bacterium]|nr:hypothetical protein [Bacteroidales bacterium]